MKKNSNMKIGFIEWWVFDSGFSISFFSNVHLDLATSQLTRLFDADLNSFSSLVLSVIPLALIILIL